jgi:hypothetical protein
MKYLIILFILAFSVSYSDEVSLNATVEYPEKKSNRTRIELIVEISNNSENLVSIGEKNGMLMETYIELWSLGKGVIVRNRTDAEWRREQAFALNPSIGMKPGEKKTYTYVLDELMPDDPDNDELSKSIIQNITRYGYGKGRIVLQFLNSENKHCEADCTFDIKKEKSDKTTR